MCVAKLGGATAMAHMRYLEQFVPALPPPRITRSREARLARRRVVVTGIGVVAPSGLGKDALWSLLVDGGSAVRRVEGSGWIAGQIPPFHASDFFAVRRLRGAGRVSRLAAVATRLAVDDARLPPRSLEYGRAGLFLGTAAGHIDVVEEQARVFHTRGVGGVRPRFPLYASPHAAAGLVANAFHVGGPTSTFSSDCPSGLEAVAAAARQIGEGVVDVMLAGGADAPLTPMLFGGFARSGMLALLVDDAERAARPFDAERAGFVLAEAGAMLVLETAEHADARGAHVYGEILGAGAGRDRSASVGVVDPSGRSYLGAGTQALRQARLAPADVGHVSAHAPGLPTTDLAEARGLEALLGDSARHVPVSSIKGALGHPLAAAGILQIAAALLAFERGVVPPTRNCDVIDPACHLAVVRATPRTTPAGAALVTSHGLAGDVTALLVGAPA
jgi:3-oxoacyl-(acyl-carrier-protein) synthase